MNLRVFLVDDHAMFRAGVRAELGVHVDVVGEAGTVAEAVTGIAAQQPDVLHRVRHKVAAKKTRR